MAAQDNPIFNEVALIQASGEKPVLHIWDCIIHAGGKDLTPLFVTEVLEYCNFIKNFCDELSVNVAVTAAMREFQIIPFKSNLEVTLRRIPLREAMTPVEDTDSNIVSFRYRATLYDASSKTLEGNSPMALERDVAERMPPEQLRLQLYNPVIEELRFNTVGSIFRNVLGIDVIRYILGKHSKTSSASAATSVKGVTVAAGFNPERREHITVPHNTKVIHAPQMINSICGGIYPSGFNYYLKKDQWFVFSPFDLEAYKKSKKTLTLINLPKNKLPSPERSYRETPTQVIIIATGATQHKDVSEEMFLNLGTGTRFMDAAQVVEGFAEVDGNKAVVKRANNVNEIYSEKRENGNNFAPESDVRITANYLTEYAKLAVRNGAFIQIAWENCNTDILYPGMPVRFMYMHNNEVSEVYGILQGWEKLNAPSNRNIKERRFSANAALTVFIARKIKFDS